LEIAMPSASVRVLETSQECWASNQLSHRPARAPFAFEYHRAWLKCRREADRPDPIQLLLALQKSRAVSSASTTA